VVPNAALKVRQALNGLAWSHSRRNAVVLFDGRVTGRSYGASILATLPECAEWHDSLEHLAARVAEWVGTDASAPPSAST
jgi:Rad3-related DNA helicase